MDAQEELVTPSEERTASIVDPGEHGLRDEPAGLSTVQAPGETEIQGGSAPVDVPKLDFLKPSEKPGLLGRFGPYEVIDVAGRGGMGIVFKAFDPR